MNCTKNTENMNNSAEGCDATTRDALIAWLRSTQRELRRLSREVARTHDCTVRILGQLHTAAERSDVVSRLSRTFYTVEQAAELLKLNASTVRRYCCAGLIRQACRVGRSYRIPAEALELFMELNPDPRNDVSE